MSKVSIIIPTYNRAYLVGRAINSILNQTFQDFEIIVVDDGSTDNTEDVVKRLGNGSINYIKHKENKGRSAARNSGIKAAKGEFIAFQDSDDEWLPEKLEKQIEAFKNVLPEIGGVYTGFWRIESNKKSYVPSNKFAKKEGDIYGALLKENFIGIPVTLIKKECFKKVGLFDEKLPALEDWELWIRISKYYQFKYVAEPLTISYCQADSISIDSNSLIEAYKLILKSHFDEMKKNKKDLGEHYCNIGNLLCSNREIKQGRRYFMKAVRTCPLSINFRLVAAISLLGEGTYDKMRKFYRKLQKR